MTTGSPADAPAQQASTSYDLYFLLNGKRFFWRNPNCGITLIDAGLQSRLAWRTESGEDSTVLTRVSTKSAPVTIDIDQTSQ